MGNCYKAVQQITEVPIGLSVEGQPKIPRLFGTSLQTFRRWVVEVQLVDGMVGAEGFEVSFPSGHFAFSSVGFKGEPIQIQWFLNFSGVSFFRYPLTN